MPRYDLPWRKKPQEAPVPEQKGLLRQGAEWAVKDSGEAMDRQMALESLEHLAPELRRHYEYEAERGNKKSATELYTTLRGFHDPGWDKKGNKALGTGLFAAQYPVANALGAAVPGVGHVAGWLGMRHAAHLANPDMAGDSLMYDLAGAAGAKGLGTVGAAVYRSKLQARLAKAGLTSIEASPVVSRVLDWAEGAMDPAIGPKARNAGLPRWLNRRMQKMGPQGAASSGRSLPLGRMVQSEIPGVPGQQTMPGTQPVHTGSLPSPMRKSQPVDELAYRTYDRPKKTSWNKTLGGESQADAFRPDPARQTDVFKTVLEELPPPPEDLTTLTQVGKRPKVPFPDVSELSPKGKEFTKVPENTFTKEMKDKYPFYRMNREMQSKLGIVDPKVREGVLGLPKMVAESQGKKVNPYIGETFAPFNVSKEDLIDKNALAQIKMTGYGYPGYGLPAQFAPGNRSKVNLSQKLLKGSDPQKAESIIHEMLHEHIMRLTKEDRTGILESLGSSHYRGKLTDAQEHHLIWWLLKELKEGAAPTEATRRLFAGFRKALPNTDEFITRKMKSKAKKVPMSVKLLVKRFATPEGFAGNATE